MRKLSSNIRPERFKTNRHRVVPNLAAPYARSIGESFIGVRMIAVRRNTRSDGAAKYLRNVELVASRVRTRDYNPAHSVAGATPKAPLPRLKEARILVKHRGENRGRPVVFDGAVTESRSEPLAIARRTLAVTRLTVFRLADSSQKGVPRDLDVVERRPGHHRKLLPGGQWRDLVGILKGQEVR